MSEEMTLRSAFHGFNRRDVLACIEQLNNTHKLQLQSLESQLQELQEENARLKAALEAERSRGDTAPLCSEAEELEVYRRAERTEREARERAARVCEQTNSALADIAQTVESTTAQMTDLLQNWMDAAESTRSTLQTAAEAISAFLPE